MAENKYALLLKGMLRYIHIKYGVLAEVLGYDISYISKWVNGIRLPAAKNIDMINQNIAHYIASVLIKEQTVDEFSKQFMYEGCNSEDELNAEIYRLLMTAYQQTIRSNIEKKNHKENTQVVIGQFNCQQMIQKILKNVIENSEQKVSICITGEFCSLMENDFWRFLSTIKLPVKPCQLYVSLDLDKMRCQNMIGTLYHCLDELLDYEITLYDRTIDAYDNIIVIENEVALSYVLNEHGNIDMCVVLNDTIQINMLYHKCINFLHNTKEILIPKKTLGMEPFGFRDMFFTSNKYFYFLAHGFEFLLPDSVFQSLLENAKKGMYQPADENWICRIQSIWKNLMDKAELRFLVPSNSLIQYLETGYIHLNDFSYKLTLDERKQHLQQVLQSMKLNPHIVLGILLPATGTYGTNNFISLSFYSNYSTAFFKKNLHRINKNTAPIYLINDARLLNEFQAFFNEKMKSASYREYTYDQLIILYKRYKYLLDNLFASQEK